MMEREVSPPDLINRFLADSPHGKLHIAVGYS